MLQHHATYYKLVLYIFYSGIVRVPLRKQGHPLFSIFCLFYLYLQKCVFQIYSSFSE